MFYYRRVIVVPPKNGTPAKSTTVWVYESGVDLVKQLFMANIGAPNIGKCDMSLDYNSFQHYCTMDYANIGKGVNN